MQCAICIQTQLEEESAAEDQQKDLKSGLTNGKGYYTWEGEAGISKESLAKELKFQEAPERINFPFFCPPL